MDETAPQRTDGRSHDMEDIDDDDRPASLLDDSKDRVELRQRYYGLLQELRVLLPGVQVLLAFLFTVPFASRFDELDEPGRIAFATSMCSAMVATVAFVTPIAFHRVARRRARSARLVWSIRMEGLGLAFMCLALLSALHCVMRFVFDAVVAWLVTGTVLALVLVFWVVVPTLVDGSGRREEPDGGAGRLPAADPG
ncbi:DUF6328 family protein [Dermatobacter hominis]|uniref:DUF6328 family protein n=1 Tax=Dermatobacter hominis TaxID=2884263 RepID=UPI001D11BCA0|nr:DUF6328 family protein [Dermatobacter hominis]UDY35181.1 DUF6328 family protein [Dermatobacter hominis]